MISRNGFVEWAKVYGERYGTSHQTIRQGLRRRKDVVLVIEVQGARALRKKYRNAVFVLILPPNLKELRRRIQQRPGMTTRSSSLRLRSARKEVQQMGWYDYFVVNDRLSRAVDALAAIVVAERQRQTRNRKIFDSIARS